MLRTSEMLQLTDAHVMVHEAKRALSVILPSAKTFMGNAQVLQVEDPQLVQMAVAIISAKKKKTLLWEHGPTIPVPISTTEWVALCPV